MTGPLWHEVDRCCECPPDIGHSCVPSWMTPEEWFPVVWPAAGNGAEVPQEYVNDLVVLGEIGGDRNGGNQTDPLTTDHTPEKVDTDG